MGQAYAHLYKTPEYMALVRKARANTNHRAEYERALGQWLAAVAGVHQRMAVRSGSKYRCYEDLVLTEGQFWTPAPRPKGVRKGRDQMCYSNTTHLILVDEFRGGELRYVEGYALALDGMIIPSSTPGRSRPMAPSSTRHGTTPTSRRTVGSCSRSTSWLFDISG